MTSTSLQCIALGCAFALSCAPMTAISKATEAVNSLSQRAVSNTKTSSGLEFTIKSVRVAKRGILFIQYAVKNVSPTRKYIILYGSGSASTDNGLEGMILDAKISGIAHCFLQSGFDEEMLQACRNPNDGRNKNGGGTNIDNYTYIEPGDVADATMVYDFRNPVELPQAKTASFKFMALTCSGVPNKESLSNEMSISQPQVLNINFAFVDLHE